MVRHAHGRSLWLSLALLGLGTLAVGGTGLAPLTDAPGDPERGRALVVDSEKGNCVICHAIPIEELPEGVAGDLGPPLDGVGARYGPAELRQRVADPKALNPDTLMPAYHVAEGLTRVDPAYRGRPILDAQEVEDVVAFLATLR
jgi:L-cysteine S-thiosulfotransferase